MAMTAAILITLSVSAEGQTPPPSPNPAQGETTNQGAGANTNNSQTTGGELQQCSLGSEHVWRIIHPDLRRPVVLAGLKEPASHLG
jgi:hypothetical protein